MDFKTIWLIALMAGAFLLAGVTTAIGARKRLRTRLAQSFGRAPDAGAYALDSIRTYHEVQPVGEQDVDETTWQDLDMDDVFRRINVCLTSVGEEGLYHALHTPQFDPDVLQDLEAQAAALDAHPDTRDALRRQLCRMGKSDFNGLCYLTDMGHVHTLPLPWLYPLLALAPAVALALLCFQPALGGFVLLLSFGVNIAVHYVCKMKIEAELPAIQYLGSMLWCCERLLRGSYPGLETALAALRPHYLPLRRLRSQMPGNLATAAANNDLGGILLEYVKILFLTDLRKYNRVLRTLRRHLVDFQALRQAVARLDMAQCILSFRKSLPHWCRPCWTTQPGLAVEDLYHPLLRQPVSNDLSLSRSALITGSNASGKSTFIKAVAINAILAQTLHTCCARTYRAPMAQVVTSMAVRDSLADGESYFIAELKSLRRILEGTRRHFCLCFVDEILKGTNTIERIAASTAVLSHLARQQCLCLVASHDIELTELMADEYDNYHFREQMQSDGIHFDYRLYAGPSATRNAIALLAYLDFDPDLVTRAQALADRFTQTQKWLD